MESFWNHRIRKEAGQLQLEKEEFPSKVWKPNGNTDYSETQPDQHQEPQM